MLLRRTYKYRLYPNKKQSIILDDTLNVCRYLYNAAWNKFIFYMLYKAEEAGVTTIGVNPRNTSRMCNVCNNCKNLQLFERVYVCDKCGNIEDRDVNAAKNILKIGLGEPEFTLVERSVKNSLKQECTLNKESVTSW